MEKRLISANPKNGNGDLKAESGAVASSDNAGGPAKQQASDAGEDPAEEKRDPARHSFSCFFEPSMTRQKNPNPALSECHS
jgi:hypothetical protein